MSNFFTKPESTSLAISDQLVSDIEQASLRAWPALEEFELDDWCLRFSRGFTKRANCISITKVNCHHYSDTELLNRIQVCEQRYHGKKQPAIFRLVQVIGEAPHSIDRVLASRNYSHRDASLLLVKKLDSSAQASSPISYVDLQTWLAAYQQISGSSGQAEHLHSLILAGIQADLLLALTKHKHKRIACGLGVLDGHLLGLFDITTHPDSRKKGFARALVQDLCAQGLNTGAKYAYLQVQEDNFSAIALYASLGFSSAYRYRYRIEGEPEASCRASSRVSASNSSHG